MWRPWILAGCLACFGCSSRGPSTVPPVAAESVAAAPAPATKPAQQAEEPKPSVGETVADPPLAIVGSERVAWDEFETIYGLKIEKYTSRGRIPPAFADLRYRRSIATRLVRQEQLAQATAELGEDYDPAKLAKRVAGQREGVEDWPRHLRLRAETEASLQAMYIAELREALAQVKLALPPPTADDRAQVLAALKKRHSATNERLRVSRLFVPKATGIRRARQLAKAARGKPDDLASLADPERGEIIRSNELTATDFIVEEVATVVATLPIGQVSKPIATRRGWDVVVVHARWAQGIELQAEDLALDIERSMPRHRLRKYLDQQYPTQWFINVADADAPARPTQPTAPQPALPEL